MIEEVLRRIDGVVLSYCTVGSSSRSQTHIGHVESWSHAGEGMEYVFDALQVRPEEYY